MFRLTATEKAEVVANCDHLQQLKFSPVRLSNRCRRVDTLPQARYSIDHIGI